jgi:hypothetical protein
MTLQRWVNGSKHRGLGPSGLSKAACGYAQSQEDSDQVFSQQSGLPLSNGILATLEPR